ncbi:MAG: hypothetical protein J1F16_00665 [Muribaculaceae bacterium]|nr:hypothetical protein [Muribaculaceae bacterium]
MIKKYIYTAILVCGATAASAQINTESGYFLDNFLYRYQMNPAMGNTENFVGFPGLGNTSFGTQGTLHMSKLIYPLNGKTVLFTNPDLPDNQVKKFGNSNKLGANLRENIITVGFKALGGYNTVSISAVANSQVGAPGSLFNMLRDGVKNDTYDIRNLMVYANSYAEIALNHSRDIKQVPGLRVGATFKFLVGMASAYGKFKKAEMTLGQDSWDIVSEGDIYLSGKGLDWETDYNDEAHRHYVSGIKSDGFSVPNGYGAAFDLGATYDWRDFRFSLAIIDLGGIAWTKTKKASTNGEQNFQTSDYIFEVNGDNDTWDDMKNKISALYQLQPQDGNFKRSTMQGTTMNIGVEYILPYYRALTFGLLNSTRMCGGYTSTEFRLSANVQPVKYVSASANLVMGTYGVGFGWLLNVTSGKGFNLFLGMDRVPGKLSKQYIPLNSNVNVNLGINFPF